MFQLLTLLADSSGGTKYYKAYMFIVNLLSGASELNTQGCIDKMNSATDLLFNSQVITNLLDNVMIPIGSVLMVVYFMMDMYDLTVQDEFTVDKFFKVFVKFLAFFFVLINVKYVFEGLNGVAMWTAEKIQTEFAGNAASISVPWFEDNPSKDMGFAKFMYYIMKSLAQSAVNSSIGLSDGIAGALIFGIITFVQVWWLAYDRAIALGLYYVFAPIALADISGNGLSPQAKHFLKRVFAVCMRLPIAVLVISFLQYLRPCYENVGASTTDLNLKSYTLVPFMTIVIALVVGDALKKVRVYADQIFVDGTLG